MAITTLDPTTALIVIDLQQGILQIQAAHPLEPVIANTRRLLDAFRKRDLPVILVNVTGVAPGRSEQGPRQRTFPEGFERLIDALDVQPTDERVTKRTWGAFTNTELAQVLENRGVTQVVVTGVATSFGVESTARQAHELGFNVTLAVDAMTDPSAESHANSVQRIFPRLGETGTTDDILALLDAAPQ